MVSRDRTSAYRGAAAHYLSPDRRDAVKRRWEEPVNHAVVATALDRLAPGPVRVLDVGAGTGDGIALLDAGLARSADPARRYAYTGIDPDPEMVTTARSLHAGRDDVAFVEADVRDPPAEDVDLWLSTGVPWSHLSHDDTVDALAGIFRAAARRAAPTAVIVDVLGRYSIEWVPRWGSDAWQYDMSFFHAPDHDAAATTPMSFHGRGSLERAIVLAGERSGAGIASVEYHDRSVLVGRHTTTGAFHPDVPRYRTMINALHDGDTTLDLDDVRLAPPTDPAPAEITAFYADLAARWNGCLDRAAPMSPSPDGRVALAEELRAVERAGDRGLGVGHSLIALVMTAPRA